MRRSPSARVATRGSSHVEPRYTFFKEGYAYGSITPEQVIAVYHKYLPNQSKGCHNKLDAFFKQWWFTSYSGNPAAGTKPSITGPGLAGNDHFYDSSGGCSDYGVDQPGTGGGTVPATLSLTLGANATFGAFTPGVAKDYTATASANVISTAGDATLSVTDPGTAPGHLVNGAFSLPVALKAVGTSPGSTSAGAGTVSGAPLTLTGWSAPVSNDPVQVLFTQSIGANDALRTGTYAKTLTFTLSTTTP